MDRYAQLAGLVARVAGDTDAPRVLRAIAQDALRLTGARHAMFMLLNDELGHLEPRIGAGEGFEDVALNEQLTVGVKVGEGITAQVAATRRPVIAGDVRSNPNYRVLFDATVSELAVPITDPHGRVRGVLNLESDRTEAFGSEDLATAEALAALAAGALENQEQREREEALIEIGSALDRALTEEALVDRVMQIAEHTLRFQACSIFLLDSGTDVFVLRGSTGALRRQAGTVGYRRGEGVTGWVCASGEPVLLDDPRQDPRWRGKHLDFDPDKVASFLAVPIVSRSKTIGAIRVLRRVADNPYLDNRFTSDDQRLLATIAEQVAAGLENLRNLERIVRSERMIAWGELSAKSSHMIGNRVFALKGDLNELKYLLQQKQPDLEGLRELAGSLGTNVSRIEEILQDFRDFLTATQLQRLPTDVGELVKETVKEVFPKRSPVKLVLTIDEGLPPVAVDAPKLRRAVSELLENALNYAEDGELLVSVSKAGKGGRERVEIEVHDSGPGVDPDRKEVIFQPFHSTRSKGMGLGLSIVQGIVVAHGGDVAEVGDPGHGARFVIRLPALERP